MTICGMGLFGRLFCGTRTVLEAARNSGGAYLEKDKEWLVAVYFFSYRSIVKYARLLVYEVQSEVMLTKFYV